MKKLLLVLVGLLLTSTSFAYDSAKLRIEVTGDTQNYYLCVSNAGCVNVSAGARGFIYPIQDGDVRHIFIANSANYRMYPQAFPNSCDVTLQGKQTLVVMGRIVHSGKDNMTISDLHCKVA